MMITTCHQTNTSAIAHRAESTDRIQRAEYPNFQQLSTSPAFRISPDSRIEENRKNISSPELIEETPYSVNDSFCSCDPQLNEFLEGIVFLSLESFQQSESCEIRLPRVDPLQQALSNTALPQETRLDYPKRRGKYLECYKQAQLLQKDDDGSAIISPSQAFAKDATLSKRLEEQKAQAEKRKSSKKRKRIEDDEDEPWEDQEEDRHANEDDDESEIVLLDKDVLAGRGGASNNHPGNLEYWKKVLEVRAAYKAAGIRDSVTKTRIANKVLDFVHGIGGRFLDREADTRTLFVLSNDRALEKIKQACRDDYVPQDLQTPLQRQEHEAAKKKKKNKKNAKNTKKNKNRRLT